MYYTTIIQKRTYFERKSGGKYLYAYLLADEDSLDALDLVYLFSSKKMACFRYEMQY